MRRGAVPVAQSGGGEEPPARRLAGHVGLRAGLAAGLISGSRGCGLVDANHVQ